MAKRYHEGRAKMLKHREYYADEDGKRTQEMQDGGMLHEDRSCVANMPSELIMKPYPKNDGYLPESLNDSITGVDRQIDMDDRKRREHFMPKKV